MERERSGTRRRPPPDFLYTPIDKTSLEAFFQDTNASEPFYLSGGTALAAFYLLHRYSDDLDFFTRSESVLTEAESRVSRAVASTGLIIERIERRPGLSQFFLSGDLVAEHRLVKLDFANDPEPYPAPPQRFDHVLVDALLSIAVNKVAIVTRDEAKDYLDLYVILHETPYRLTDLIPLAKQKLLGLDEWAIADKFARVRNLRNVAEFLNAYMVRPIDWRALVKFYEDRAEELLELFPPQSGDHQSGG
ncbi:MAG: nucleotidyl transferase AbiEii/AbiGii toxin family protein [bacterium]